jgi:transcriptional regulator with XRE-family HTH domain
MGNINFKRDTDNKNAKLFWQRYEQLAEKDFSVIINIGLPQSTLSTWKKRGVFPRVDIAYKIAYMLNTSVEYLLTGNNKPQPDYSPDTLEIALMFEELNVEELNAMKSILQSLSQICSKVVKKNGKTRKKSQL